MGRRRSWIATVAHSGDSCQSEMVSGTQMWAWAEFLLQQQVNSLSWPLLLKYTPWECPCPSAAAIVAHSLMITRKPEHTPMHLTALSPIEFTWEGKEHKPVPVSCGTCRFLVEWHTGGTLSSALGRDGLRRELSEEMCQPGVRQSQKALLASPPDTHSAASSGPGAFGPCFCLKTCLRSSFAFPAVKGCRVG